MNLENLPARTIVRAIAAAARRWSDADFPARVRVAQRIVKRTGYSAPVVDYSLDRLFFPIDEPALTATIESELGSLAALDGFAPSRGRPDAWARPAGRVCVIASRTTIGVALAPALFALCAKCDVVVKDREDALVGSFFGTLWHEIPEFAFAARASPWKAAENGAALDDCAVVVAFGRDETLREIRNGLHADCRFVGFGSRASAGYVARETLQDAEPVRAAVDGAARDLVLYESEGCLSLHILFVERAAAFDAFCEQLAKAVERAGLEFPIGAPEPAIAAARAQRRGLGMFRASAGSGMVFSNAACEYVLLDAAASDPPHFLPRTLGILAVDSPDEAAAYLRRHRIAIEGFALSSAREDIVRAAVQSGAARLTAFGQLQDPPFEGRHGGRQRIADFVSWVERSL